MAVEDSALKELTDELHRINSYNQDECHHGTYTGGPSHGEPYADCERTAEMLLESGVVILASESKRLVEEAERPASKDRFSLRGPQNWLNKDVYADFNVLMLAVLLSVFGVLLLVSQVLGTGLGVLGLGIVLLLPLIYKARYRRRKRKLGQSGSNPTSNP